jgi:hypothetical protein
MDVCSRHNLIKRVPLLASKKWREGSFLAVSAPLLCLICIIDFVSMTAWHVRQLPVCNRVYVVHA